MNRNDLFNVLYKEKILCSVTEIGSFHAFGEGADKDFVILVYKGDGMPRLPGDLKPQVSNLDTAMELLAEHGFKCTTVEPSDDENYPESDHFKTMRKDDLNLMVTEEREFFANSVTAFEVVKALNLRNKADRIKVHQIVVDGLSASDVA